MVAFPATLKAVICSFKRLSRRLTYFSLPILTFKLVKCFANNKLIISNTAIYCSSPFQLDWLIYMQFTIWPRKLSGYTFTILHFKLFENYKVQVQFLTILVYCISHMIRGILITLTPPPTRDSYAGPNMPKKPHYNDFLPTWWLELTICSKISLPTRNDKEVSLNAYTLFESRIGRG